MTAALHTVRLVPVGSGAGGSGVNGSGADGSGRGGSGRGGSGMDGPGVNGSGTDRPHVNGSGADGGSAAALFEARVTSAAGVHHGLLAADPSAAAERPGPGFVDEHLMLDLTEPGGLRWRRHADVLHLGPVPAADVHARLAGLLAAHPGCAVATAEHRPGAVLVLARSGARLVLRASGPAGEPVPPPALGSLAHAWLAAGRALGELDRVSAAGCRAPGSGWSRLAPAPTPSVTSTLTPPGRPDGG
ncbi:hypothetical protein [Kitasatospora sp. NPDC005856]|uniref:hypothetical protein n=1 Tax=Kitasatospora sp. NPDC005856 TaxID=3154566 RepID=UPI0033FBFA69